MLNFWGGIAGFFQTIWFIVTYRDPAPSVCNGRDRYSSRHVQLWGCSLNLRTIAELNKRDERILNWMLGILIAFDAVVWGAYLGALYLIFR